MTVCLAISVLGGGRANGTKSVDELPLPIVRPSRVLSRALLLVGQTLDNCSFPRETGTRQDPRRRGVVAGCGVKEPAADKRQAELVQACVVECV